MLHRISYDNDDDSYDGNGDGDQYYCIKLAGHIK